MGKVHEPILTKSESHQSIRFAYVSFKNLEHAEYVMRALNMKRGYRFCVTNCFSECCCPKAVGRLKDRLFYDQWLECDGATEPDQIIWENLGVSDATKPLRRCCIYLVFLILLIGSLLGLL